MTNEEYTATLKLADNAAGRRVLNVLNRYGDNKWWLSDDPRTVDYFQLMEPILVVLFDHFHAGVEKLLGRPVWTHEFGLCLQALKNEATNAWLGVERDDAEKVQTILDGMDALAKCAEENGQTVIIVDARREEK